MKKIEVLNNLFVKMLNPLFQKEVETYLDECKDYDLKVYDNGFTIESKMPEKISDYYISIRFNISETNEQNLICIRKEYCPQVENRYGYREQVATDMFSKNHSMVLDAGGTFIYESYYSDDNKYFLKEENGIDIDSDKARIPEFFEKTSPKYIDGYIVEGPTNSYIPFTNQIKRIDNSNIFVSWGRNPMSGEYSYLGVYDNNRNFRKLLEEHNGLVYGGFYHQEIGSINEVVPKLEELYYKSFVDGAFDVDMFQDSVYNYINSLKR